MDHSKLRFCVTGVCIKKPMCEVPIHSPCSNPCRIEPAEKPETKEPESTK